MSVVAKVFVRFEVLDRSPKDLRIVVKLPECSVAIQTKRTPYFPCLVAVIYVYVPALLSADEARACGKHLRYFIRQAVLSGLLF